VILQARWRAPHVREITGWARDAIQYVAEIIGHRRLTMKGRRLLRGTALAVLLLVPALADVTGKWAAAIDTQIGVQNYTYDFKVDGDKLTGRAKSQFGDTAITEGTVKGDEISFVENLDFQGQPLRITYKGKVSGEEIKFTRQVGDVATEEFVATRAK
jgi:hypothetical protein